MIKRKQLRKISVIVGVTSGLGMVATLVALSVIPDPDPDGFSGWFIFGVVCCTVCGVAAILKLALGEGENDA